MTCPSECPESRADERLREERDRLLRLAAVGEVLPSLLHELRNPIAGVTTALEVLIEEMESGELRDTLHALLGELRRAQLTLQGIGTADRALRGDGAHHAIDHALRDACRVMSASAREAGVELRTDIPDLPLLPIDAPALRGVVFNLLNNAIAAARAEGASLPPPPPDASSLTLHRRPDGVARGATVDVVVRLDGTRLVVTVRDTGTGMKPEVLARCTELFFTTKARGSGIGLALARRTVESVGGSMAIESELGKGTSVTLSIPIEGDPPRSLTERPGAAGGRGSRRVWHR